MRSSSVTITKGPSLLKLLKLLKSQIIKLYWQKSSISLNYGAWAEEVKETGYRDIH